VAGAHRAVARGRRADRGGQARRILVPAHQHARPGGQQRGAEHGPGQGTGESLAGISAQSPPFVGELICQLGAFSGPRCDIEVISPGFITFNTGADEFEFEGRTRDGSETMGNGDSGGPVITLGSPGFFNAVGTNSAKSLNTPTACVGVQVAGRQCSSAMFFPTIGGDEASTGTTVSIAPGG
jgi:hypothetical protein